MPCNIRSHVIPTTDLDPDLAMCDLETHEIDTPGLCFSHFQSALNQELCDVGTDEEVQEDVKETVQAGKQQMCRSRRGAMSEPSDSC